MGVKLHDMFYLMVLVLIMGIVGISGCTDNSTSQNKTFNESGISFQYPSNWSENVNVTWNSGAPAENETLGTMGMGNVTLAVLYVDVTKTPEFAGYTIEEIKDLALLSWQTSSVGTNILRDTNRKIGDNKTVYEIIYSYNDPVTNAAYKDYYVVMGEKGKSIYILRFDAPESEFAKNYNQFKDIVSSVEF